jgi:UDP-glucose 4-epimerase
MVDNAPLLARVPRVAIAGTSGLIGSAVARQLSAAYSITSIGRRDDNHFRADLSDPDAVGRLDFRSIDYLVHCAGIVDEDFADPVRAFRQATQGMAALVNKAKSAGIRKFVYVSSAHVYGPLRGTINELSPPNPLHDYAIAHFASEQSLRRVAAADFRAVVLRPCAVFGIPPDIERFRRWSLIPFGFPRSALESGVIALASRGIQRRNFAAADDVAEVVAQSLDNEGVEPFTTVNVVGNQTMTVYDFAELCCEVARKVTGKICRITRPDGPDPDPDHFQYATIRGHCCRKGNIAATIECLMRRLSEAGMPSTETT